MTVEEGGGREAAGRACTFGDKALVGRGLCACSHLYSFYKLAHGLYKNLPTGAVAASLAAAAGRCLCLVLYKDEREAEKKRVVVRL